MGNEIGKEEKRGISEISEESEKPKKIKRGTWEIPKLSKTIMELEVNWVSTEKSVDIKCHVLVISNLICQFEFQVPWGCLASLVPVCICNMLVHQVLSTHPEMQRDNDEENLNKTGVQLQVVYFLISDSGLGFVSFQYLC